VASCDSSPNNSAGETLKRDAGIPGVLHAPRVVLTINHAGLYLRGIGINAAGHQVITGTVKSDPQIRALILEELHIQELILEELRAIHLALTPQTAPDGAVVRLTNELSRASRGFHFTIQSILETSEIEQADGDSRLRDLIIEALEEINARKLGALIATHEGRNISGKVIRRGKKTSAGVSWKIEEMTSMTRKSH
jgi:DNA integrity scanning protein DisA with diadenylate cyclase activity